MQINLNFDASASSASPRWIASIEQAASLLDTIIPDRITVNFDIGYGEVGGEALGQNTLGATADQGYNVSYSQLVAALEAHPTSQLDQQFLSTLPSTNPNNGQTWFVPSAEAKVIGLVPATSNTVDAYIGFTNSIPTYYDPARAGIPSNSTDLIGVALHELTHGLGRALGSDAEPMSLMAYGSNGRLDLNNTQMRFISYDGGKTSIGTLDTTSDPSDLAEGTPTNDPFNAYLAPGTDFGWTTTDTAVMEMLGFHVNTTPAATSSALASIGLSAHDFAPTSIKASEQPAATTSAIGSWHVMPHANSQWIVPVAS